MNFQQFATILHIFQQFSTFGLWGIGEMEFKTAEEVHDFSDFGGCVVVGAAAFARAKVLHPRHLQHLLEGREADAPVGAELFGCSWLGVDWFHV